MVADGVRGKGWRVGVAAQAMSKMILAMLIGNQVVNLFTRGHTTFQNPEDGHKLDAWIPGGGHGFFFSPLSMAAEFSHELVKYMGGGESSLDALTHIAGNKLSGGARAAKTLATGKDWKGQPFTSMGERLKAAALDLSPLPMQTGAFLQKDPKATFGYSVNHQSGSLEKQLASTVGMKLEDAPSPRSQMYRLAQPFRAKAAGGEHGPSKYAPLRQALDNKDRASMRGELVNLLKTGETLQKIGQGLGVHSDPTTGRDTVSPELFTGSKVPEARMYQSLTPAQKATYRQAQADRGTSARLYSQWASQLAADPEVRKLASDNAVKERAAKAARQNVVPLPGIPAAAAPRRRSSGGGGGAKQYTMNSLVHHF